MNTRSIQERIRFILGITQDQQFEFVTDMGIAYAEFYTLGDVIGSKMLTHTKAYWLWYNNQWEAIDRKFLHTYEAAAMLNKNLKDDYLERWRMFHQPQEMRVYPGQYILEHTYAEMMGQVIDELHKSPLQ